jgi:hypothetical protein
VCTHQEMTEHSGREIKVYDESRHPRNWNELLNPSQCAVFFSRINSVEPLSPQGLPVARFRDCTFLLFDKLDDVRRFCEAKVQECPEMCCEVFDSKGKARPPLLTIVHPRVAEKDELSSSSVRKRAVVAVALFIVALPLIWWDWHAGSGMILPTVFGINMIFAALRLLQWNAAQRQRSEEQEARLKVHLTMEKTSDEGPPRTV